MDEDTVRRIDDINEARNFIADALDIITLAAGENPRVQAYIIPALERLLGPDKYNFGLDDLINELQGQAN